MGFNSQDDLINEVTTNGKFFRADWNKITGAFALTAGGWYDFSQLQGVPLAVRPGELVVNGESPQTITGPVGNAFNWTANGTAWVASAGVFAKTSGTATTLSADSMNIPIVIGRSYRVQYTITAWTSSNVNFTLGGVTGTVRAATGTFIEFITATTTANLVMQASVNTGVFSINNISVVEWGAGLTSLTSASQIITDTNNQGALYHGGNVSTDTKHLLNMAAVTAVATGVPAVLMLVDLLQVYPFLDANSVSAQSLTNINAQSRYANGTGVRAFMVPNRLSSTFNVAAHNLQLSYTNTASVTARAIPVTVSGTTSLVPATFKLTHTGLAANQYGPFLPMAQGDQGIKSVQTYTQSAVSGANTFYDLIMCKPLATIPLTTASVAAERDLVNQLPSMPQIKDGACLGWLYFAGQATGASTNFYGSLDLGWG